MRRTSRLSAVALVAAAAVGVAGTAAYAAWSVTSSNASGTAAAGALGQVTGVASSNVTSTGLTLTWNPVTNATAYTVSRSGTDVTGCVAIAATTCTVSSLTASTPYTFSVVAQRGLWRGAAGTHSVSTAAGVVTRTFGVSVTAPVAGSAATVTLTALDNGSPAGSAYVDGPHTLTFSGAASSPNGTAPTYPTSVSFTNGVGTASVTFVKAETFTLTVSEASPARSGQASVTVTRGAANRLRFTSSDIRTGNSGTTFTAADCAPGGTVDVGNGGIFRSRVSVTDLHGNPVANGASAITLTVSRSPSQGTLSTPSGSTTIAANTDPGQSSAAMSLQIPTGSPTPTALTVSAQGLTSVTCTVQRP